MTLLTKSVRAFVGICVIGLVACAQARADCQTVQALLDEIRSEAPNPGPLDGHSAPVRCDSVLEPQGQANYCRWSYSFRASGAQRHFEELAMRLRNCSAIASINQTDQGVNHPDGYWTRQFETEREAIVLSLKDKSQIDRSFVFLRLSPKAERR